MTPLSMRLACAWGYGWGMHSSVQVSAQCGAHYVSHMSAYAVACRVARGCVKVADRASHLGHAHGRGCARARGRNHGTRSRQIQGRARFMQRREVERVLKPYGEQRMEAQVHVQVVCKGTLHPT